MPRVGVEVGDLLRPHRAGVARYTRCLLAALTPQRDRGEVQAWARWRRAAGSLSRPPEANPLHFFARTPPRDPPQVFHAAACVFPEWRSPVEIATVHDLYAVREELNLPAEEVERRTAYIRRADRLICVSRHTRDHVHARLDIPESRTVAIPNAVPAGFSPAAPEAKQRYRRRHGLPGEFLLFVGRDRANKNLERLVSAYAASRLDLPLVLAGRHHDGTRRRLTRFMQEHDGCGSLRWLDRVSEADLPVLLSCASALCLPSTFEGFGLPIVEAMACGTPVLTSAGRATEEAAGGEAILVDPESVESIAAGLEQVLQMSQAQRERARLHATRRTWDDVAADTWQVYVDTHGRLPHS